MATSPHTGAVTTGTQFWAGKKILQDLTPSAITATGNITIYKDSATVEHIDPAGSSRNLTADTNAEFEGNYYKFVNKADASENLVFKNSGGTTIATIGQNQTGEVCYSAGAWTSQVYTSAASGILSAAGDVAGAVSQAQDFGTNGVLADVIGESSSGAGVAVDGVLLKDGGFNYGSGGIGTAAAAGTNQGTATALTKAVNYITASDGVKGVALPTAVAGLRCVVHNTVDTAQLYVYPASSDAIGTRSANAAVLLPGGGNATFEAIDATTWIMNRGREGDGQLQSAEVSLTASQIKALRATPITVVAAPGSGKILEFMSAMLLLDYGTTQFAEDGGGSNLGFRYTDGSGIQISQTIESTGFIDQAADTMTTVLKKIDAITAKTGCENKAIVIHNIGAGEIVTGDSVMRIKLNYRVWTTGW